MTRLRRFFALSQSERYLVLRALVAVAAVRLALWVFPFPWLRKFVERSLRGTSRSETAERLSVDRITWSVEAASRLVPRATCLTQALAAHVLLARGGYASRVRVGVARAEEGEFKAHAWLEHGNEVVIGGAGMTGLTPLPMMEDRNP